MRSQLAPHGILIRFFSSVRPLISDSESDSWPVVTSTPTPSAVGISNLCMESIKQDFKECRYIARSKYLCRSSASFRAHRQDGCTLTTPPSALSNDMHTIFRPTHPILTTARPLRLLSANTHLVPHQHLPHYCLTRLQPSRTRTVQAGKKLGLQALGKYNPYNQAYHTTS